MNEKIPVAINPHNPDIMYLGTRTGLYRSNDAGASWSLISNIVEGDELYVQALEFDPQQPERLYIGTLNKGIYQLITDSNCMANYDTATTKLSIPCLRVDNLDPSYKVDLTKQPSGDAFGITSAE